MQCRIGPGPSLGLAVMRALAWPSTAFNFVLFRCRVTQSPCRYFCYLLFSLKTHNQAFQGEDGEGEGEEQGQGGEGDKDEDEETHQDIPVLSLSGAFFMLTSITVVVAIASE